MSLPGKVVTSTRRPAPVLAAVLLLLAGIAQAPLARAAFISYDFQTAAAQSAIDGQVSANITADGVPLFIEAGVADSDGGFVTGVDTLFVDPTVGLGVNGEQIRDVRGSGGLLTTAVRFTLDSAFTTGNIATITLNRYFAEDLVVFADGVLLGRLLDGIFNDFSFVVLDSASGLTTIELGPLMGTTELLVTTSVAFNDDSNFFIAELRGVPVPAPATGWLLVAGLLGLAGIKSPHSALRVTHF